MVYRNESGWHQKTSSRHKCSKSNIEMSPSEHNEADFAFIIYGLHVNCCHLGVKPVMTWRTQPPGIQMRRRCWQSEGAFAGA